MNANVPTGLPRDAGAALTGGPRVRVHHRAHAASEIVRRVPWKDVQRCFGRDGAVRASAARFRIEVVRWFAEQPRPNQNFMESRPQRRRRHDGTGGSGCRCKKVGPRGVLSLKGCWRRARRTAAPENARASQVGPSQPPGTLGAWGGSISRISLGRPVPWNLSGTAKRSEAGSPQGGPREAPGLRGSGYRTGLSQRAPGLSRDRR